MIMNFSEALARLKEGNKLTRKGWNGKSMYICVQYPDDLSKMSLPYIYILTVDKKNVPWVASNADLFTDDWVVI